jgi:deazaflavin-dependent oxidoreductase (nitroreductase family)
MPGFKPEVLDAVARTREVTLATHGRKTGKPVRTTIWVGTDGRRIFIRSGGGLGRHWPQNLTARDEAVLHVGGESIKVRPRHVIDPEEARAVSHIYREKYGSYVKPSTSAEPLTDGEKATFELLPVD